MCKLGEPIEICNELKMTCFPEVNRLLVDLAEAEALNSAIKERLLSYIQFIMVKGLHKEVH